MATARLVIALGGNAITLPSEEGNIGQQFAHTRASMRPIADLIQAGHRVVLTHGNGPQVGNILRRSEIAAEHNVYPIPLELCVADTQGGMGYMISQCLQNELLARGIDRRCATVITTVLVDPRDPEFRGPTKPIGIWYADHEAQLHIEQRRWHMEHFAGRGWRRVVASPAPLEIVELELIRRLTDAGDLVVCCGGGGIGVARSAAGEYRGVEAVIDKDRTAALLAAALGVDVLVILTGVSQVCVNFGKPDQRPLGDLALDEARRLLAEGHFPRGSMGPKIEAAIEFLSRHSSGSVVITDSDSVGAALEGRAGTRLRC
jgi:carbamate kinase